MSTYFYFKFFLWCDDVLQVQAVAKRQEESGTTLKSELEVALKEKHEMVHTSISLSLILISLTIIIT